MKPHIAPDLYRTENDTDDISLICKIETDAGIELVDDVDTVKLYVKGPSSVITITGSAKGDSSGTFLFDVTSIKSLVGRFSCEVEVNNGSIQTIGLFQLIQRAEIG